MLGQYPFLREVLPCPLFPVSLWRPPLPCARWHFLSLIDLRVGTQCRTAKQGSSFPVHGNGFTFGQRTPKRQKVVVSVCQGRLGQIFGLGLKVNKTDRYLWLRGYWLMNCLLQRTCAQRPLAWQAVQSSPKEPPMRGRQWPKQQLLLPLKSTSFPVHPILRFLNK